MAHALGIYYCPEHHRPEDRDFIAKLQPPVIRLLDPDVQQIADMHRLAPNAIIATRIWSIDDNGGEAVRNLVADPIKTGIDHANRYSATLGQWREQARQRGLTLPADDHIYFNAANEPNQGGTPDKIAAYNIAFLRRCTELRIHATALCLGVGWPDNTGPNTPVNWQPYAGLVEPMLLGAHMLELHEYNYKTGPQDGWTWLAGRHLQCPFDVPILLGEVGVDNYVDKARWDKEGGNRGWQGNVSPDAYADMLQWHIQHSDTRVVAALPFLLDFRNREWASFDIGPAKAALLARKDSMIPQGKPPTKPPVTVPSIDTGAKSKTMWVSAPAGLNLRSAPRTGNVLVAIPFGAAVEILETEIIEGAPWSYAKYGALQGWLFTPMLSADKPQPTPAPDDGPTPVPQPQDNWARAWPIVLSIEGGLSLDPNDSGNYYQGKLIGTKYGISAAVWGGQYDIPNLTKEQALEIYKQAYWDAAGCNKLTWPMCLVVFDTAIQHGVNVAKQLDIAQPSSAEYYLGQRALRYMFDPKWATYGIAWGNRIRRILEASE